MENTLTFSPTTHAVIGDMFALALSAHVAGFVYFLLQRSRISPRYRMASTLSALVMISSAIAFLRLLTSWNGAFVLEGGMFVPGDSQFAGQARYVNWMVTVPLLLSQVLVVVDLARQRLVRLRTELVLSGILMVVTGYVGYFSIGTSTTVALVWFVISTVPFLYLLARLWPVLAEGSRDLPGAAGATYGLFRWFFVGAWTLYPLGYLAAVFFVTPGGAVASQLLYTIADISSKIIYGILLTKIARIRSTADGYEGSFDAMHPGDPESTVAEIR